MEGGDLGVGEEGGEDVDGCDVSEGELWHRTRREIMELTSSGPVGQPDTYLAAGKWICSLLHWIKHLSLAL